MRWKWKTKATVGSVVLWAAAVAASLPAAGAADAAGNYLGPGAVAASKDGRTLYVACGDARQVAWVDLPGGSVTRRVAVPAEPTGLVLTPDGTKLIVTCAAPQSTVAVLDDGRGPACWPTIPAGHTATGPALSPGRHAAVRLQSLRQRRVGDRSGRPARNCARVAAVREPIAAAVTPDGRRCWWPTTCRNAGPTRTSTATCRPW